MVPRASPGTSPKSKALSRSAIRAIADRRIAEVVTVCGCILIPEIVNRIAREVHCPAHGWQKIDHKATVGEIANVVFPPSVFPDTAPF
jgi:hypothetical protein